MNFFKSAWLQTFLMITDMRGVRTCFERHGARAGVTRLSGDGQKEIMRVFALRSYKKSIKTRNKASDAPTARYNPQNDRAPAANDVREMDGGEWRRYRGYFLPQWRHKPNVFSWRKESEATFCKVKQREKTERRDSWTKSKGSWKIICENEWYNLNLHRI